MTAAGRGKSLLRRVSGGPWRRARPAPAGPAGQVLGLLDAGTVPDLDDVVAAVREQARAADQALGRSAAAAAAPLAAAAALAFHRTLHFDGLGSPLAAHPDVLLQPLRESTAWRRATAPGSDRREPPRPRPGRPRLLFVTLKNWKFLDPVARAYEARDDVEVRRLDLADLTGLPLSPLQQLRLRLTAPPDARSLPWAGPLAQALDGADTVFLDWLQRGAVLLSAVDPGRARVVTRLHSFEAFTVFPHLVGYGRVDDLVVVGEHLGRFLDTVAPAAARPHRHVLANHADLRRFAAAGPKPDDARFTLAVVGYGVVAKDPLWAVEVLARLRAHDDRYRLLLVGADLDPQGPAAAAQYRRRLEERIGRADVAGAVERVPFTEDVPALLRRAGVVVSSSVRESFHLALVEGAASGAVPVVRRWPLFEGYGGPEHLFPTDWVVDDVDAAAARVRSLTADAAVWRSAGAAASQWVLDRYDDAATTPRYDDLLLGIR